VKNWTRGRAIFPHKPHEGARGRRGGGHERPVETGNLELALGVHEQREPDVVAVRESHSAEKLVEFAPFSGACTR
jgi:hypothetical protein